MPVRRSCLLQHGAVIGFYLLIAVLITWPVAAHLGDRIAGYPPDNYLYVWTMWAFRQELLSDLDPLHTTYIFYPEGVSLALHTLVVTKALPGVLLQAFLSPVTVFNLSLLVSIALGGYTTWLLVRHLTGDDAAALVGGLVFACSPFYLAHATAGHLNYISAEGIPLFCYFFVRSFESRRGSESVERISESANQRISESAESGASECGGGSESAFRTEGGGSESVGWQDALYAGLAMAYTALSDWAYVLYLLVFCALFLIYHLLLDRRAHLRWPVLRQYAIAALVAVVCSAPLMVPAYLASRSGTYDITRYVGGAALYVSDLLGFFVPSPDHFLVGDLVRPVFDRFTGGRFEGTVYLGFSVLILSLLGGRISGGTAIWRSRRTTVRRHRQGGRNVRRFWLAVALLFALISLGPGLHVLGHYRFPWLSWMRMGTVAYRLGVPMKPEWIRMFDEAPMIPLPGAVLQLMPFFKWTRTPSRFIVVTMLALAVLAGFGVASLRASLQRIGESANQRIGGIRQPAPTLATALVGAMVLLEFCIFPFPTTPATVPPFYHRLAGERGSESVGGSESGLYSRIYGMGGLRRGGSESVGRSESVTGRFAILELPIQPYQRQAQYWQTVHARPLVYGYAARVPEERFAYLDTIAGEISRPTGYFEAVGIRYLLLHTDQLGALDPGDAAALRDALDTNFELVETSGDLRVYSGARQ